MALSRYGGVTGSRNISEDYENINTAFNNVEVDVDAKATIVNTHISNQSIHVTQADHNKLNGIEAGAEANQNAFSRVNGMNAELPTDEFTIVGDVGINVTQNPNDKSIHLTVTGESAPGAHAATHLSGGSDPIPTATPTTSGLMPPESFQAIEDNADAITDITAQLAETANHFDSMVINVKFPPSPLVAAVGDGVADDTAAIQACIDYVAASLNGGVVYLPTGTYLIKSLLQKAHVSIVGANPITSGSFYDRKQGSYLFCTDLLNPAVIMRSGTSIERIFFFHPNQKTTGTPTAYPASIKSDEYSGDQLIRDVVFINSYIGIDTTTPVGSHTTMIAQNLYGYPLSIGVKLANGVDVDKIENIHFSPKYYPECDQSLREWVQLNGKAFVVNRSDWSKITNAFVFGYGWGAYLDGVSVITLEKCGFDECISPIAIVGASFGVKILNCEFVAKDGYVPTSTADAITINSPSCDVTIDNARIWGTKGNGVVITDCISCLISNSQILQFGLVAAALSATKSGIRISGGKNVKICNTLIDGESGTFKKGIFNSVATTNLTITANNVININGDYGIYLAPASDYVICKDNVLKGTLGISDNITSAKKYISDNLV